MTPDRGLAGWLGMLLLACVLCVPALGAQTGTTWDEATVGSEWDLYARALAVRGLLGDQPWAIRPFAPGVLQQWSTSLTMHHPWEKRLSHRDGSVPRFRLIRPMLAFSDNTGFAWGFNDGPVWQGRGLNTWATVGALGHWGPISFRLEPLLEYGQNAAFELEPVPTSARNPYVDALRPATIDLPQRMGDGAYRRFDPGQSYVRLDVKSFGIGLSTEDLFWGPGVQNAILFGPNAPGFPHIFLGTNRAVSTRIGGLSAQVVYGQLLESPYAPKSSGTTRLGAGFVTVWQPPHTPFSLGIARFYHRAWPSPWTSSDYTLPLGAFLSTPAYLHSGIDNQLVSVFFNLRARNFGLDLFGEFGKNDRNADSRDLAIEPENNSAWLLGFLKVIGLDSSGTTFWTLRGTVADGRIPSLKTLGRGQATFYEHSPVSQGHTSEGQLLGTPLIDRSGGVQLAIDRYMADGRLGLLLMERQMPPDKLVGMPPDQLRSQWDLGASGLLFHGGSDISVQIGHVWDLNRFPGRSVGNYYVRLMTRFASPFTR